MARQNPWPEESWTAEQKRVGEKIRASRGQVSSGPLATVLRVPEIAEGLSDFVGHFAGSTLLDARLKEFVMLVVARQYTAQYMWAAHEKGARNAGLPDAVIERVRAGDRPVTAAADELLTHDMTVALVRDRTLDDALYGRAVETWGEDGTIEMIALIGFYKAVATVIMGLRVEAPGDDPLPIL